jgi:hypothetical protein
LLINNAVQAVSVGVNGASAPPEVPSIFIWRDNQVRTVFRNYVFPSTITTSSLELVKIKAALSGLRVNARTERQPD